MNEIVEVNGHFVGVHPVAARELERLRIRVAELEAKHPEWMKRIQRERQEERERIIAHLGTAFLGYVAHDPEKHLFMVGTENVRRAIESMP